MAKWKFQLHRSRCAVTLLALLLLAPAAGTGRAAATAAPKADAADSAVLAEVEFKQARVQDAVRTISELTGINIVATGAAGDKTVTFFVRDASVTDIVDSLCRIAGLWYRRNDETGIFIVMTAEEYQKDIVVFRREPTRSFQLKFLNVGIAARTIADLFGDRVEINIRANYYLGDDFRIGDELMGFEEDSGGDSEYGGSGSSSGSRSSSSGSRSRRSDTRDRDKYGSRASTEVQGLQSERLSSAQIARLEQMAAGNPQVSEGVVGQVAQQRTESPIYVTINRLHNILFVRTADEQAMEEIAKIVRESDQQIPEVLLEMKVLEVQVTDQFESAFNLGFINGSQQTGPDDGQVANPLNPAASSVGRVVAGIGNHALQADSTMVFQVLSGTLRARLQLLATKNNVKTLATPMLLATNNQPARLFIGREAVITTGFETQANDISASGNNVVVNTTPVPITEVRSIGNTLTILPSINADRSVVMRIVHENSNVEARGGNIPVLLGGTVRDVPIDTVNTSTLEGTFLAQDGMTVAVGGMMRTSLIDSESKVPLLGDVPGLGFFFKEKLKSEVKTELILLITPHVLGVPADGEAVTRQRLGELSGYPADLKIDK